MNTYLYGGAIFALPLIANYAITVAGIARQRTSLFFFFSRFRFESAVYFDGFPGEVHQAA